MKTILFSPFPMSADTTKAQKMYDWANHLIGVIAAGLLKQLNAGF